MVRRLADQGLLAYERYRGVRLTDAGRRAALRTIRRHRVIEAYLVKALGYPWDRVHMEAERLEHAASDELHRSDGVRDRRAGNGSARCADSDARRGDRRDAASLARGRRQRWQARVVRVSDENDELLRYLDSLGIRPGVLVTLGDRAPFEGPLSVRVGQTQHQIGHALAAKILVDTTNGV